MGDITVIEKTATNKHFMNNPVKKVDEAVKKTAASFKEIGRDKGLVFYEDAKGRRFFAKEGQDPADAIRHLTYTNSTPKVRGKKAK